MSLSLQNFYKAPLASMAGGQLALCGQTDGPRLTRSIPRSASVDATGGNHTVIPTVFLLPKHEFP